MQADAHQQLEEWEEAAVIYIGLIEVLDGPNVGIFEKSYEELCSERDYKSH
jgi:hypothetical protein